MRKGTPVVYRWRYQDALGGDVAGPEEMFADQLDAEAWLEQRWSTLLHGGVAQVTLLHGEAEVYGPMSLLPAGS